MPLIVAEDARLDRILDDTYPIWGEGLSREAYGQWNRAQCRIPWGRERLQRVALADGDTILASAKRYRFTARAGGEPVEILGIGAVFTAPALRGRGYARQLVDEMMAEARRDGAAYALLFSEIGAAYYERAGFVAIPRSLVTIDLDRRPGAPATFVRSGEPADFATIAAISATYSRGAGFALERPASLVEFALARRRLRAGLGPPGLRQTEFFVAEEGYRAAAYVVVSRGPGGLVLEECGDRDPAGARVGAILQVLMAREPAGAQEQMLAWLPPDLRPPQVRISEQRPAPEIMMIRPVAGLPGSMKELHPVVYWQADVF